MEQKPVTEILKQIESQTDYRFSYNPELLKNVSPLSLKMQDENIEKVLDTIFSKTDIQFIIRAKHIILKRRPKEITISGFIYDRESHESLISANIIDLVTGQGTVSNSFGFYSISLPPGKISLHPSYVGYTPETYSFTTTQDTVIHFFLQPSSLLKEVVVEGELKNPIQHVETGKISFRAATLKAIPAFMGESDVIKALQQMPGVAIGTDAMAGLYVRGGNADENLYLVDGNPLYHVHHLLGLFSTFNPEAVKTMDFYKGSFPARYGGRLSSVVDVRMNDGDMKKTSGAVSIGLISSRLNLQGPIMKDKTSYSVSLRRTYLDLLARPAMYFMNKRNKKENPDNYDKIDFGYYFYDFNAKVNHRFSDKSRLYLSLYSGKDKLFFNNESRYGNTYPEVETSNATETSEVQTYPISTHNTEAANINIGWGTRMASLNWAYAVNSKLFANTTLVYSRFRSDISLYSKNEDFYTTTDPQTGTKELVSTYQFYNPIYRSGIEDKGYRLDFDYAYNNNHLIRFGTALLHHNFRPEESRIFRIDNDGSKIKNDTVTYADEQINVKELSLYAEDEMDIGQLLRVNAGLHLSGFFVQGKSYLSAQPRLSARYLLSDDLSLKASYGRMSQYVHLLQSSYLSSPNDLWVPITKNVKPLSSYQFSVGLYGRYRGFDLSAETYYKKSSNQVEYKDGASILTGNSRWEDRVAQGIGTSYGVELMAKKSIGNSSGWIGYTLSWTDRQFPGGEINQGKRYPAKQDNRHKINAVFMHKFNRKFDLNLSWIYATGNWTTLPEEEYINMHGVKEPYIERRNNYKMPNYQRLDLSFNYYRYKKKGRMGIWNISIYNTYAHHNSFLVLPSEKFAPNPDTVDGYPQQSTPAYQSYSLFPIIPSFSYTYKF
ncbi:MAG: TonB-dependent receptor [Proteiniphilum sp.]